VFPGVISQAINHPMVQMLEELSPLADNPRRAENEQPLISEFYAEVTPKSDSGGN
jgi:hypothetical protein